ncbi:MAG: formylglycine-generating enzyme family protein [Clostridia bacterium]|nr:formylglycine-generating enzyme family protein [Clostridia bacterium]
MINTNVEFLKSLLNESNADIVYSNVKDIFGFNEKGEPNVVDGEVLYWAWKAIQHADKQMEEELMNKRFYDGSKERYISLLQNHMKKIDKGSFSMGSAPDSKLKYIGEEPQHNVDLDQFFVSDIVISEELYSKYDPFYKVSEEKNMPARNVSWYDAVMFCKWINCRLLTEAEWEYASKGDSKGLWCCEKEEDIQQYGWFSESSDGYVHPIGLLKPNSYGLYDIHGNVWEWCQDSYDENYYEKKISDNPVNDTDDLEKVCRGGSIHAFSEMCRCAFRDYEPANFKAYDIGFRVARSNFD